MKTVYIETVGCQMNVLDSELVIAALKKDGYTLTDSPADADVILFNTCSVRELAEEKTYSAVGRVMPHKRRMPVSRTPHRRPPMRYPTRCARYLCRHRRVPASMN